MTAEIPLWAAIFISFFLVLGAFLTLAGAIGLTIFKSFYERLHAPTLGTTWGIGAIIIASIMASSFSEGRFMLHGLLLAVFLVVTTPITLMLLSRAAIHRDEIQDWKELLHKGEEQDN